MDIIEEKIKANAARGIFASILIFIIMGVIFILVWGSIFLYIDSYSSVPPIVKGFVNFFDHPGFNGFTLLEMASIINTGFFILSLFFFITNRGKKR